MDVNLGLAITSKNYIFQHFLSLFICIIQNLIVTLTSSKLLRLDNEEIKKIFLISCIIQNLIVILSAKRCFDALTINH